MVFVVERRTMRFLPTKVYCIIPGCGLVYRDHENVSPNWPKIHCSRKFYSPKNTHYTVCISQCILLCIYQQVLVMNSLRKPKRLTIRGDDEKEWMFLVKAGEDLRLDQRIEQVHVHMYEYTYIFCSALR